MRTTVDLPDELHKIALSIARDRHQSLSRTLVELIRRGLEEPRASPGERRGGFPLLVTDRPITADDVRSLDDDE